MTAPEKPDALRIARWWVGDAMAAAACARHLSGAGGTMLQTCAIHAAEQVAVERGLGEQLLRHLSSIASRPEPGWFVRVAFAPLEARALALHRLVCKLELEKEKPDARFCRDGGACHHGCEPGRCYREECCSPLTGYMGPWREEKPDA